MNIKEFLVNNMRTLEIKNLHARVEEKEILKGINLKVNTDRKSVV